MTINSQVLAGAALLILGALGAGMLVVPIPAANATAMTFILGALAGAITVSGGGKPPSPPDPYKGTI